MSDIRKAVVLAAGKGTRLGDDGSGLPKPLRDLAGRPMLGYVLDALAFLPPRDTVLVLGGGRDQVKAAFPGYPTVAQSPQLGDGHAVLCAQSRLDGFEGDVLVCRGDMPLVSRETYEILWEVHIVEGNACTALADAGIYIFKGPALWRSLTTLRPDENGEYHLSGAWAWLKDQGEQVGTCAPHQSGELLSATTPEDWERLTEIIKAQNEIV